jgi:hypothetical protein
MKNEDLHAELPEMWEPAEETEQSPLTTMPVKSLTDAFIMADKDYISSRIIQSIESGESDPLKVLAGLKAMESLVNTLTDKSPKTNRHADKAKFLNDCVMATAGHYSGKTFPAFGATFTKTEVGTKYDWSRCNDAKLSTFQARLEILKGLVAERQEFLKRVPVQGLDVIDSDTGETYTVYPPSKSSTSTVSVSFK